MNDHLFHLEKLLNLRIMEEQRAALELASKSSEVQKLKEQISDLKSQLLKLRTAIGKENLIKLQSKMAEIQKKVENFTNMLYIIEKEKNFMYQNYLDVIKNRKILENLRGKYGSRL